MAFKGNQPTASGKQNLWFLIAIFTLKVLGWKAGNWWKMGFGLMPKMESIGKHHFPIGIKSQTSWCSSLRRHLRSLALLMTRPAKTRLLRRALVKRVRDACSCTDPLGMEKSTVFKKGEPTRKILQIVQMPSFFKSNGLVSSFYQNKQHLRVWSSNNDLQRTPATHHPSQPGANNPSPFPTRCQQSFPACLRACPLGWRRA